MPAKKGSRTCPIVLFRARARERARARLLKK